MKENDWLDPIACEGEGDCAADITVASRHQRDLTDNTENIVASAIGHCSKLLPGSCA